MCAGTLLASLLAPVLTTEAVTAQESSTTAPPVTEPPTTQPPTTAPSTTGEPSTTQPSTTEPSTTEPPADGGTTTTILGDGTTDGTGGPLLDEDGNPIIDVHDPALHEEKIDEGPPDVDVTVPPPDEDGLYEGQGGYQAEQVLISSVRDARAKLQAAEDDHVTSVSVVKSLRLRLKRLEQEREDLDIETQGNLQALTEAEQRLRARALSTFVRGGTMSIGDAVNPDSALAYLAQQTIADVVFEDDDALIAAYLETRDRIDQDALSLFDRTRVIVEALGDAELDVEGYVGDMEQAARELEAFEAGSQIYIKGVVFPIQWPYDVPLIDSWGFPRMTGTADSHWHEGIDIFAPAGTPLLATERGVVTRIGSGRLGGLRLWLRGESGTDWYYAHLSGFAEGLSEGQVVEVGEIIGYVGNTGNAVGTPPHLHMQVHPNGGEPVNPYPLLKVVSDRELWEAENPDLVES